MIHRIFSTLPTFKELTFHDGLNILLSDKSPNANDKQTRNGAGKSSFVETVHFLTGANVNADSMFRNVELVEHSFGMEFDLAGDLVTVERSGLEPTNVTIRDGNWSQWPYEPVPNEKTGKLELPNTEWRLVLGSKMFNLSSQKRTPKYSPTFRALFSYFARRQSAQAFLDPVRQSEDQVLWDQQVMITFLLGLDWSIPQSWQFVRDEEKTLKELRKAASAGAFGAVIGKVAELRTKLTIAEGRVEQLRAAIQEFQVLPQYREYEAEATSLTRNIGRLTDDNLVDSVLVADLESTIKVEDSQLNNDLEQLYREVGVILPEMVTRRFDEVRAFHNSVIDNRLSYLQGEIETARGRIENRNKDLALLESRRSEILSLLKSHGALDHLLSLQTEYSKQTEIAEALRQRYQAALRFEEKKAEADIERGRLLRRLQQDHVEQDVKLRKAILSFEQISRELYETAGSLTVAPTLNGPKFEITMTSARSKGIGNMKIFCFDIMLMQLCAQRGIGPGFLIHDSHLFDGVDERQIAKALQIGAEAAKTYGFQYIVTMNSDVLPDYSLGNFNAADHVLRVRLTDQTLSGGLFGLRFQ